MSTTVEEMLLEEIRVPRKMLERIETLLEEPLPDEVKAIEEYEAEKKGEVEPVKLEDVLKGTES